MSAEAPPVVLGSMPSNAHGSIRLSTATVEWDAEPWLNAEFEKRLLFTAKAVCEQLEFYSFEQLTWVDDQPYVAPVVVEKRDDQTAVFKVGPPVEFSPEALFGSVATRAFDMSNEVYLLSDANPSLYPGPRVVYVNEAFERMTGYKNAELIGQTPRLLQGPETCPQSRAKIREGLKSWSKINIEMTNYRKDQTKFRVHLDIVPITDALGWYVYWFAVQQDVTEQRKRNAEREATARRAGIAEVATDVLHNVGNVLNSVNVSTSYIRGMLSENGPLDSLAKTCDFLLEEKRQVLQENKKAEALMEFLPLVAEGISDRFESLESEVSSIEENVEHIKQVVASQQQHARFSAGSPEEVLVSEAIDQALNVSKGHLWSGIEITKVVETDSECIVVEKHKLLQILANLLKNAIEALAEAGTVAPRINFKVFSQEQDVVFRISDNGPGFDDANLEKLFSHGYTTKDSGSGFGLHACTMLAMEMSGKLSGHSEGPGKGATFELKLPADCPVAGPQPPTDCEAQAPGTLGMSENEEPLSFQAGRP